MSEQWWKEDLFRINPSWKMTKNLDIGIFKGISKPRSENLGAAAKLHHDAKLKNDAV